MYECIHVYTHVCMCVFMYVCMHVCACCVRAFVSPQYRAYGVCMACVCIYMCVSECIYRCIQHRCVYMCVCLNVSIDAYNIVCVYICVCLNASIDAYNIDTFRHTAYGMCVSECIYVACIYACVCLNVSMLYASMHTSICLLMYLCMTVSTQNPAPPKSTKSRNSNSSVSRGTNSN